jgi:hypothetical protein
MLHKTGVASVLGVQYAKRDKEQKRNDGKKNEESRHEGGGVNMTGQETKSIPFASHGLCLVQPSSISLMAKQMTS